MEFFSTVLGLALSWGVPAPAAAQQMSPQVGVVEAAAPLPAAPVAVPAAAFLEDLERARVERREAFRWFAPAGSEEAAGGADGEQPELAVLGHALREVLRIGPGEWRVQVRERWNDGELRLHSVERLSAGRARRVVERELRGPSGRTVFATWDAERIAAPASGPLRVDTSGEGAALQSVQGAGLERLPTLGRPALVELLRRGLAPERAAVLDPLSGRFEASRIVELPALGGLRVVQLWGSPQAEPPARPELRRWWIFRGAELLSLGGPAGTAWALRCAPGTLPPMG